MPGSHVTLIVDRDFGPKLVAQAALGPIWAIRSPTNEAVMKRLWFDSKYPPDHLTIFDDCGDGPEGITLEYLDTVDMHHHGWRSLEVIGAKPSATLLQALRDYGEGTVRTTNIGFVFSREPSSKLDATH